MKKLLSLITAIMMLLSIAGAAAEGATEATVSLTLDAETIGSFIQSIGGVTGEEETALANAILGLVNNSSAVITWSETGFILSLRLKDAEVADFRIYTSESEVSLSSNLFPSYVMTFDPAFFAELAGSSGIEISTQSMEKASELLIPYGEDINLAFDRIMADGPTEEGTFTPDGTVVYTQCMSTSLTTHTALLLIHDLFTRLQQDQEMLSLIETLMVQAGEETNLAEQLAEALSQVDEMFTEEPVVLAELRLYTNETGSYYKIQSTNQEEVSFLLTLKSATEQDGSSSQLSLIAAAEPVTDWDTAKQKIISGQIMDGLVLVGSLDNHELATGVQKIGNLQILGAGLDVGLSLDSFAPTDTSEATVTKIGLSFGDIAPLAVLQFSSMPVAPVTEAIDLNGKTKIVVNADTSEEDLMPLLTELVGIGLPRMMIVMTEQMPEVTGALLAMLIPKAAETTIVPEETVPEPEGVEPSQETVPVTEAPLTGDTEPGKLTVTQESFQVLPYSSYYQGVVYAQITNTGSTSVEFESGTLELLDALGNTIGSRDLYYCYPEVLTPGEVGYLYDSLSVEEAIEASYIAGYNLTVNGKEEISKDVVRLPSTGKYEVFDDDYWPTYYLSAVVENETDEAMYDTSIVYALKDAGGNLLYITQSSPYGVGIMPHASIGMRTSIYSDTVDYFTENNLDPVTVDTIAYISSYK